MDALLHETEEVEIEGEKVPLHKLNTRINKWTKELKLGVFKTGQSNTSNLISNMDFHAFNLHQLTDSKVQLNLNKLNSCGSIYIPNWYLNVNM